MENTARFPRGPLEVDALSTSKSLTSASNNAACHYTNQGRYYTTTSHKPYPPHNAHLNYSKNELQQSEATRQSGKQEHKGERFGTRKRSIQYSVPKLQQPTGTWITNAGEVSGKSSRPGRNDGCGHHQITKKSGRQRPTYYKQSPHAASHTTSEELWLVSRCSKIQVCTHPLHGTSFLTDNAFT